MDTERHGHESRYRGLVERVIFALHLEPRRLQPHASPSALAQTAARALRLAVRDDLSERDRRLLIEAETTAPLAADAPATAGHALLGGLAAGWAARNGSPERWQRYQRDAALVAAVALTALVPRASRGDLERRLLPLSELDDLDPAARSLARQVALGGAFSETGLARDLTLVLDEHDGGAGY